MRDTYKPADTGSPGLTTWPLGGAGGDLLRPCPLCYELESVRAQGTLQLGEGGAGPRVHPSVQRERKASPVLAPRDVAKGKKTQQLLTSARAGRLMFSPSPGRIESLKRPLPRPVTR